ncbi:MAG: AmmeMemoRadiSam system protein B [Anaerolineaceae bacterium]|nr:AmmeMemoRadiSam system protein B [Anaerolineaceae bacterium]
MEFKSISRPSPIAGTWYIGDPTALSRRIDAYINDARVAKEDIQGTVIGLTAPHAGHRFSGKTAGYAYKTIKGEKRDLVVILSPFHQYFPGDLITTAYQAYTTPLGEVPVDTDGLIELENALKKNSISIHQISNDLEHSLEIQLPFLQRALKNDFKLLPLMIRSRDANLLKQTAEALFKVVKNRSFLVIASTDLSHFYPLDIAEVMDAEMLKRIKEMSPERVLSAEREGRASACGASSVAVMLWLTQKVGARRAYVLNYSTSADSTGDKTSVVGYGSAAVTL